MSDELQTALAQIKDWSFDGWQASAFEGAAISTIGKNAIATILNAVASGDLHPAPAVPPVEQEPVAWRVRVRSDDPEEWSLLPAGGGADYLDRSGYECQPLYARPAPSPAVPDDADAMMADGLLDTVRRAAMSLYGETQTYPCDDVKRMAADAGRLAAVPDDVAGIVAELRVIGCHENGDARCTCGIGMDAADALEAQAAELARLRDEIEKCKRDCECLAVIADQEKARADAHTAAQPAPDAVPEAQWTHFYPDHDAPPDPSTTVEGFCVVTGHWGKPCPASMVPWSGVNHVTVFRILAKGPSA